MGGVRKIQVILVVIAVVITGIIYLAPKKPDQQKQVELPPVMEVFSFDQYLKDSRNQLPWESGSKVDSMAKLAGNDQPAMYDSIASIFDIEGKPASAAWYYEQKVNVDPSESTYLNTAYRYFDAFKAAKDSAESGFFVSKAIENYKKVLEINPDNLNAKTDLGICYVEGTPQPMQGITLLREVVETNPDHEYAQLNLGFLSMKSGQFEKAAERFTKVLEINPARIDMYIYLGEAQARMGNNEKAVENLEMFTNLSGDRELVAEVQNYIDELKGKRSEK